ncbi:MAG: S41 family peptidase, partial [Marinirhabdus sp.]
AATLFTACFEDRDDVIGGASPLEVEDFIYRGLNFFYVYKADTPELANNFFATAQEKETFLNSFGTPQGLFSHLRAGRDRFSVLVEDYVALENALGGTTLNNGMEYGLVRYPDGSGNVFGYVRYVLPNTSASENKLQRGNIFNTIDGVQITENNFSDLLAPGTYTIGLATFDGETVTPTEGTATLIKTQYTEDPIFIAKTLDIAGSKVGYLMYNGFTGSFDAQLNAAFAQFKADGVGNLVLDLRYNSGGSVRSATYLSGMVTGQFTGKLLYQEQWNADRQADYAANGVFLDRFVGGGEALNSLQLTKLYVLTTQRTASASELVINSLAPYINVVQVGTNTTGKYQASFILYDAPAPGFSRGQASPNHTFAMLPLVFQTANATGNTGFDKGLPPDIE